MQKYLPRDTDSSSYADVSTGEPVHIAEHGPHCDHPRTTWFQYMDKRSDDLAVYEGRCCVACGRIVGAVVKRD